MKTTTSVTRMDGGGRALRQRAVAMLAAAGLAGMPGAFAQGTGAVTGTGTVKDPGSVVDRGRYLVRITGCNDCHTPGYNEAAGKVDEKLWLVGTSLGWNGPWGTTYASNLRLVMQQLTEAQWLVHARSQWRPPMPWFNLAQMTDADLVAVYRYVRQLGPAGEPVPRALPPGQEPPRPYNTRIVPAR